jgi:hypothetical protein
MREDDMKRTMILGVATAAAGLVAVTPAAAQYGRSTERGWRTIAYRQVNGRDTDTIHMRGHVRERRIRVCAINQPLHLRDFDIRYQNGGRQDVSTRAVLRAGTCTRAVDLRGRRRDINAVRLRYAPIYRSALRPYVRIQVR